MVAAPYPLRWPSGWPRTRPERRQEAMIEATFAQAVRRAMQEANLFHARTPLLSLNVPLSPHGTPLAGYGDTQPDDTGAALYFSFEGEPHVVACDHWSRVEDNIQAIAQTIETLRRLQRIGGFDLVRQAMKSFAVTVPEGGDESWWNVLGVPFDAPLHAAEAAYRGLVRKAHPDRGGSDEAMVRLNMAIHEARQLLKEQGGG